MLICLLCATGIQADPLEVPDQTSDSLSILISTYQKKGYDVTGPVQYLKKTTHQIFFYRLDPISFKRLTIITPDGNKSFLKQYDFVYVLSKKGSVVLVHIKKRGADNV